MKIIVILLVLFSQLAATEQIMKPKLIGYFSQKAYDRDFGIYTVNGLHNQKGAIYTSQSGETIITEVIEEGKKPTSKWDDLKCVGEVFEFVRPIY